MNLRVQDPARQFGFCPTGTDTETPPDFKCPASTNSSTKITMKRSRKNSCQSVNSNDQTPNIKRDCFIPPGPSPLSQDGHQDLRDGEHAGSHVGPHHVRRERQHVVPRHGDVARERRAARLLQWTSRRVEGRTRPGPTGESTWGGDPGGTRGDRTKQRPGPDNDHTLRSFCGPKIPGTLEPGPEVFLGPDNDNVVWS